MTLSALYPSFNATAEQTGFSPIRSVVSCEETLDTHRTFLVECNQNEDQFKIQCSVGVRVPERGVTKSVHIESERKAKST